MDIPNVFRLQATKPLVLDGSLMGGGVMVQLGMRWLRGGLRVKHRNLSAMYTTTVRCLSATKAPVALSCLSACTLQTNMRA